MDKPHPYDPFYLPEDLEHKLIQSTKEGRCQEVISMIKDLSIEDLLLRDGYHLLHIVAQYNQIELFKILPFDLKSKLTVKNSLGHTPLITTIVYENYDFAKYLYNSQIKEESTLYEGWFKEHSLLHILSKTELSSAKIGIATAIVTDCQFYDVVRFNNSITTEFFFRTAIELSKSVDFKGVVSVPVRRHDWPHLKVILRLATTHMNVNWFRSFWEYIMAIICELHKSESGQKFLNCIFSSTIFNDRTLRPLEVAMMTAKMKPLKVFLEYDFASIIKAKYGRYILASIFGNPSVNVKLLFKTKQIDINGRGYEDKTPLHFAIENCLDENIKFLLQLGANPNAIDENGDTPLALVLRGPDFELIVKSLLLSGANPLLINGKADLSKENFYKRYLSKSNHLVIAQILVYEALGESIVKTDKLFAYWSNDYFDQFVGNCRRQLNELKMHKINDTQITMFTVLTENPEKVARFASQEDVQAILEYNGKWLIPYYSELLKKRSEDIGLMHRYRQSAIEIVSQIIGIPDPYHLVVNKIVDYFSANDLRQFEEWKSSSNYQDLSSIAKGIRFLKLRTKLNPIRFFS